MHDYRLFLRWCWNLRSLGSKGVLIWPRIITPYWQKIDAADNDNKAKL